MHTNFRIIDSNVTLALLLLCLSVISGCNTLASKSNSGVVVARRAEIRSSTAVVAAKLLEVTRGDPVEILESVDVVDPTDNTRKERWLRVRAQDEENTEGWIEARNVMPHDVHESAKKLAGEDKGVPSRRPDNTSQFHLRLTPDRAGNDNIIMRLDSGSSFEITGWKRVPKPKASETIETDVAPKAGSAPQSPAKSGKANNDEEKEPEELNELWYKVRLPADISPAPAGWIYGKQVELTVPSDIIFYRTGREFVAWQRLDGDPGNSADSSAKSKDAGKEARPGSWVILEKSNSDQPHTLDEPDFDRIYVLGYDKRDQEHYTAYRSPDLKGFLPCRVTGGGDSKTFTIRVADEGGQIKEVHYSIYKDARGYLKVNAPAVAQVEKKRK